MEYLQDSKTRGQILDVETEIRKVIKQEEVIKELPKRFLTYFKQVQANVYTSLGEPTIIVRLILDEGNVWCKIVQSGTSIVETMPLEDFLDTY